MISDSAAAAVIAAPAPCSARMVSSQPTEVANPPARDAAENSSSPTMNILRRPRRSPARPPSISSPPKASEYALTTHSRLDPDMLSAVCIFGSATLTMVASSTTISCAVAMTTSASPWCRGACAVPPAVTAEMVMDGVSDMDVSSCGRVGFEVGVEDRRDSMSGRPLRVCARMAVSGPRGRGRCRKRREDVGACSRAVPPDRGSLRPGTRQGSKAG